MFPTDGLLVTAFLWTLTTGFLCQQDKCTPVEYPAAQAWGMETEPRPMALCLLAATQRTADAHQREATRIALLRSKAQDAHTWYAYEAQHYVCLPEGATPLTSPAEKEE